MDEQAKVIVSVPRKKVYQIGDGATRLADPGERPLTGEEKYQKTPAEALADLGMALNNLACDLAVALSPLVEAISNFSKLPEVQAYLKEVDTKAAARKRSHDDLLKKRREMMRRKGRR